MYTETILYVISITISYFFYRYCFIHMDKVAKEVAPLPIIIIILMFVPIVNLLFGVMMYMLFIVNSNKNKKFINKIFNIKE